MKIKLMWSENGRGHRMRCHAIEKELAFRGHEIIDPTSNEAPDWLILDFDDYSQMADPPAFGTYVCVLSDGQLPHFIPALMIDFSKNYRIVPIHYGITEAGMLKAKSDSRKFVLIDSGSVSDDNNSGYMRGIREFAKLVANCGLEPLMRDYWIMPNPNGIYLAIGDGGLSAWERLWLGIPQIIVPSGKSQKAVARHIESMGAGWRAVNFAEAKSLFKYLSEQEIDTARKTAMNLYWSPGQIEIVNKMEKIYETHS